MYGTLYIVSTPIGNMEDITIRALRILEEVDLIAAEDTRHTQKLLNKYNIKTRKTSYHEHNRFDKAKVLIRDLKEGIDIALVSDAGTPCISDPGWELVDMALKEGIKVTSVPGATALLSALTLAGIDTSRFSFYGFLSQKSKDRKATLEELKLEKNTIVLYESPHRIVKTLIDLEAYLGDRYVAIIKEITKMYENVTRFKLGDAIKEYEKVELKGEFVLVITGKEKDSQIVYTNDEIIEHINKLVNNGLIKREAIKQTAKDLNIHKRDVYDLTINKN